MIASRRAGEALLAKLSARRAAIEDEVGKPRAQPDNRQTKRMKVTVPHSTSRGYEMHSALKYYNHSRRPTCRMNKAMFDVVGIQQHVIEKGGATQWKVTFWKDTEEGREEVKIFKFTFKGRRKSGDKTGSKKDSSYRSAKARLTTLVSKFNDFWVFELAYDTLPPGGSPRRNARQKLEQVDHGTTNALSLYNVSSEKGVIGKLKKVDMDRVYMNGILRHRDVLDELDEDQETKRKCPGDFDEHGVRRAKRMRKDVDMKSAPRPTLRPRKRPDAKVSSY